MAGRQADQLPYVWAFLILLPFPDIFIFLFGRFVATMHCQMVVSIF